MRQHAAPDQLHKSNQIDISISKIADFIKYSPVNTLILQPG